MTDKPHLTLHQMMDDLNRRQDERLRAADARLAAAGLERAPQDRRILCGCPRFSFVLRWDDASGPTGRLSLSMEDTGTDERDPDRVYVYGAAWPEHGAEIHARDLLEFLVTHWLQIGRGYSLHDINEPVSVVPLDEENLPGTAIRVSDREISIVHEGRAVAFGSESLIVVEVLKTLGDLAAARCPDPVLSETWWVVRDDVQVFPFEIEDGDDSPPPAARGEKELEFYSHLLSQGPEALRLAAQVRRNRAVLEQDRDQLPLYPNIADEGSLHTIAARTREAAQVCGLTEDEYKVLALHEHLLDLRADIYYKPWPNVKDRLAGLERKRTAPIRNRAQCRFCGEIVESRHRHDYRSCDCGKLAVDGGTAYAKRNFNYLPDGRLGFVDINDEDGRNP